MEDRNNASFSSAGGGRLEHLGEYTYLNFSTENPVSFSLAQVPVRGDGRVPPDCWFTIQSLSTYLTLPEGANIANTRLVVEVKDLTTSWNKEGVPLCVLLYIPLRETSAGGIFEARFEEKTEDQIMHALLVRNLTIGMTLLTFGQEIPQPVVLQHPCQINLKIFVPKTVLI